VDIPRRRSSSQLVGGLLVTLAMLSAPSAQELGLQA
jgi:hypothetical protein